MITMWILRCSSCDRPWLSTYAALLAPCPFCGCRAKLVGKAKQAKA